MATTVNTPNFTPPKTYPPCTEPGYMMTLTLGRHDYQIFAYTTNEHRQKKYLPSNCDPQTFERIRGLTWGLLNAHEARRASLNEPDFEINILTSKGLAKTDQTLVSHDFLIQPYSQQTANQMASTISLTGKPMQAAAVKAQDVWNSLEKNINQELGRIPNPVTLSTATNSPVPTPASTLPAAQPATATVSPPSPNTDETQLPGSTPQAPNPAPPPPPSAPIVSSYKPPVTAIALNLRGMSLEQSDWYEQIPVRAKLRIITDILEIRGYAGGVYEKVWKLFQSKVPGQPASAVVDLLTKEQKQLSLRCRAIPTAIPAPVLQEANQLLAAFHEDAAEEELQEKILSLMEKEFEHKEELFQCIREHAVAEGVVIEDWDQHWAKHHFIENTYRFAQALARWIDNN